MENNINELVKYVEQPLSLDDLKEMGEEAIRVANNVVIADQEQADFVSLLKNDLDDKIKEAEERIKPHKQKAKSIHTFFCDKENEVLDRFRRAKEIHNLKLVTYELLRRENEAREQSKADEKARLAGIDKALEEGQEGLAEAILEGSVPVTAEPVEKVKTSGTTFAERWTYEIIDVSQIPDEYVIKSPNKHMLRALATSRKDKAVVPGVRFYPELGAKKARKDVIKRAW